MYDRQYYAKIEEEESEQARRLAGYLLATYAPRSVIDFGCATGLYLQPFERLGIDVLGIDYAEIPTDMQRIRTLRRADLRHPIEMCRRYDLALCIEVLEHITAPCCECLLDAIADASDLVLLSAACPGQGGVGHVNLQDKSYWIERMNERGFGLLERDTEALVAYLRKGYHLGWLANNAMLLRRER